MKSYWAGERWPVRDIRVCGVRAAIEEGSCTRLLTYWTFSPRPIGLITYTRSKTIFHSSKLLNVLGSKEGRYLYSTSKSDLLGNRINMPKPRHLHHVANVQTRSMR